MGEVVVLPHDQPGYPKAQMASLSVQAPAEIAMLGNPSLLHSKPTALFCSVKCPGDLILKTYDLACEWRDAGVPVIGGFHSPMERECLTILLRGRQPVIVCPARSLHGMRVPAAYQQPLVQGRLLMLSPFGVGQRRATKDLALIRNRLVAALADWVFVSYAEPKSHTEQLCRELVTSGKRVCAFDHPDNTHLFHMGLEKLG